MNAGKLDRRITILRCVESKGSSGEILRDWTELASAWARRVPQGAAEKLLGRELVSESSVLWSIRWRDDVTSEMRIKFDGRQHQILGVYEGQERHAELLILTTIEEPERDA